MQQPNRRKSPPTRRPAQRILIVDDHPLVRRGLTALIETESDLEVCAAVGSHREGLEELAASEPDLVIADLSLGDGAESSGLTLVRSIRALRKALPILVLSMHEGSVWEQRATDAGASGYVSKRELGETVMVAIRRVLEVADELRR